MKRKAAARSRPVSRGGFSLNGGYRNRGGIGIPTFASRCSANDPTIIKGTTQNSLSYITRDKCCDEVAVNMTTDKSQSEYLDDKVGLYLSAQDSSVPTNVTKECPCTYVEYKNGQHGAPYESYDEYNRKLRSACTDDNSSSNMEMSDSDADTGYEE